MKEKKLKIVAEFDKSTVQGVLFLLKQKLSDEVWDRLTKQRVVINPAALGEEHELELNLLLISLAIVAIPNLIDGES